MVNGTPRSLATLRSGRASAWCAVSHVSRQLDAVCGKPWMAMFRESVQPPVKTTRSGGTCAKVNVQKTAAAARIRTFRKPATLLLAASIMLRPAPPRWLRTCEAPGSATTSTVKRRHGASWRVSAS
jgi:hypothetical protein